MKGMGIKIVAWLLTPITMLLNKTEAFTALKIASEIQALEKKGEYEQANVKRKNWLLKLKNKNTAPLWGSEGDYQLYHQKNYEKALKAFQNAIETSQQQPLNFGKVNIIGIYYGATVSAIQLSKPELANEYFKEFFHYLNVLKNSKSYEKYLSGYNEGIKWIKEQLNKPNEYQNG